MDAAGKDGTIRHVMSGVNPQGVQVSSFKVPSAEDLDHDYLWRYAKKLPERGNIGIFNRSHYEEVLVVRVHPQILAGQKIPPSSKDGDIWQRRFREINDWEHYLTDQGFRFVKLFLNLSKEEQRRRFLARIDEPEKNWKFSANDAKERAFWDDYQKAFARRALQHQHRVGALVRHPGRRQAVRAGRRRRRPRPHPDRDRPAVPDREPRRPATPSRPPRSSSRRQAPARRRAGSDRGRARREDGEPKKAADKKTGKKGKKS